MEIFQWSGEDLECEEKKELMKEELADILIYSILFADRCNFDIDSIILSKIDKNNKKYPLEKSKNSKEKYTNIK